jgi:hypothetical protein
MLDPRPGVDRMRSELRRLRARGALALRFAVIGWRVAVARERVADRLSRLLSER